MAFQGPFDIGHRFLYKENDADRLLYRARFMNVLLLPTGALIILSIGNVYGRTLFQLPGFVSERVTSRIEIASSRAYSRQLSYAGVAS